MKMWVHCNGLEYKKDLYASFNVTFSLKIFFTLPDPAFVITQPLTNRCDIIHHMESNADVAP